MGGGDRTEAMIAIRAARTAVRVARDVEYPAIGRRNRCLYCGELLIPGRSAVCAHCAAEHAAPSQPCLQCDFIGYAIESEVPTPEDLPSPMWLNVVLSFCIVGVGIAVVVVASRT